MRRARTTILRCSGLRALRLRLRDREHLLRVLLIFQFFGPYHIARWRHWRSLARAAGWTPMALQVFRSPDLYRWRADGRGGREDIFDLGLVTNGRDNMRWLDTKRLYSALSDLRPDVVLVNGWAMRDAILAHAWCRWSGVRRVIVSDSQQDDFVRNRLKEGLKREIIRGVGSGFVGGAPHRRYLEVLGLSPDRVSDGLDVVDNAHFSVAQALRRVGGHRILTVARLSPEKNLLAAGEAFLRFMGRRRDTAPWKWMIVGYGPQESQIRALAARSQGAIEWLGLRQYPELPAIYADADLYWQPSVREPWALAVNEAMASGLPVLVSRRCGCHEDLVTGETGWTFDPYSSEAMVQALDYAAQSHAGWPDMGRAAAALIADWDLARFSSGVMRAVRVTVGQADVAA